MGTTDSGRHDRRPQDRVACERRCRGGALGFTLPIGGFELEIEVEHGRPLRITEGAPGATSWAFKLRLGVAREPGGDSEK